MLPPIVRPRVEDLVFRLFDRPVHPELFDTLAHRTVRRDGYAISARITPTGHALEWTRGAAVLTEVIAARDQLLPERGRVLSHRFQGERLGRSRLAAVRYEMSSQVEVLPPEVFRHVHDELVLDGTRRGLLFHFRPHNRLGLTPLGFVTVEPLPSGLAVSAFHTFPDEFAVVKTQSLIEPRA